MSRKSQSELMVASRGPVLPLPLSFKYNIGLTGRVFELSETGSPVIYDPLGGRWNTPFALLPSTGLSTTQYT